VNANFQSNRRRRAVIECDPRACGPDPSSVQPDGRPISNRILTSYFNEADISRISTEKQTLNSDTGSRPFFSMFDFRDHLARRTDGGSPMQGLFLQGARLESETKTNICAA